MEKIIVRLTIFGLAIYLLLVLCFAWNGVLVTFDGYVILLDYCLYRLACDEGRYHCKYARALPLNLMFTDMLSTLDNYFNFIPDFEIYLYIISGSWAIATITTIVLGINHFRKFRKLKKKNHEYEEYHIR